jgi:hypothetical protein
MVCFKCKQKIGNGNFKHGLHMLCYTSWFKVSAEDDFVSLTQRSVGSANPENQNHMSQENTSFFHGKFKKYSADLASESYIIKMRDEKEAPELPEVEYVCNQIADLLGLPIPDCYYLDFYGQRVFVTKVFIKKNSGSINLEHIYKFRPDAKHNCEALADVIGKTTNRPYDVDVFYNTILFDALVGNHDRHGRNLAFLVTPSKTILSPIYDNVSYLSLVTGEMLRADFKPTGKIATIETKEPTMKDYVKELKRLDQLELVKSFFNKVKMPKIEGLINESFCSDLMKTALKVLINKRYQELKNGLQN